MGLRRRASKFPLAESPDTSPPGFSEAALRHHSRRFSRYSEIAVVTSGCAPYGAPATLRRRFSKRSNRLRTDNLRVTVTFLASAYTPSPPGPVDPRLLASPKHCLLYTSDAADE